MSETDALSSFNMSQFNKPSVYLKFEPGKSIVVRVLTIEPIIFSSSFEDKRTGETVVSTKFAWTVFNFTANKAQVMQTTPNLATKLQELHTDEDFGANLRAIDLKITPPAPGVIAAYEVQVLLKAQEMSQEQIREAANIDLDKLFEDKGGMRITSYDKKKFNTEPDEHTPGVADQVEDIEQEPINMNDIPF